MNKEQWDVIKGGGIVEISEEDFEEMLDVLPPAFMGRAVKLMNGDYILADFGFVEGADRITAFWKVPTTGRFFAAGTTLFSRG